MYLSKLFISRENKSSWSLMLNLKEDDRWPSKRRLYWQIIILSWTAKTQIQVIYFGENWPEFCLPYIYHFIKVLWWWMWIYLPEVKFGAAPSLLCQETCHHLLSRTAAACERSLGNQTICQLEILDIKHGNMPPLVFTQEISFNGLYYSDIIQCTAHVPTVKGLVQ